MTRRILAPLLISLALSQSLRAEEIEQLVLTRNEDGVTQFGLVYLMKDETVAASMVWSGPQLLEGRSFAKLKLAVFSGARRLSSWMDYDGPIARYPGDMGTNLILGGREAVATIRSLRSARLVLSLDREPDAAGEYPATHFIDIGALCRTFPAAFQNAESSRSGCP